MRDQEIEEQVHEEHAENWAKEEGEAKHELNLVRRHYNQLPLIARLAHWDKDLEAAKIPEFDSPTEKKKAKLMAKHEEKKIARDFRVFHEELK